MQPHRTQKDLGTKEHSKFDWYGYIVLFQDLGRDGARVVDASKLNESIITCIAIKEAPILEIARALVTSPLEYFLSS